MMDDPFLRSPPQKPTKQAQAAYPTPAAFELPKPVRSVEQIIDPEASNADLADLLNIMSPGRNQRAFASPSLPKQSHMQGFPDRCQQDIYSSNYTEVQSGPGMTDFGANLIGPQPTYGRQVFTPQKAQFSHPQTHVSAATKPVMQDPYNSTN